jgi:anti-sigma B factor antagonist
VLRATAWTLPAQGNVATRHVAAIPGGYGAGMQESPDGGVASDPGDALGPADEQLVRIEIGRVAHATTDALVVTVAGEIDLYTVDRLRTAVNAGFDQLREGEVLVIDLTKVTFLSSQGLQVLMDVTHAAKQRRTTLPIVVDHTRPVIRPIEVTGLDDVLALFPTVEEALHAVSR